jgi:hypothetical protein
MEDGNLPRVPTIMSGGPIRYFITLHAKEYDIRKRLSVVSAVLLLLSRNLTLFSQTSISEYQYLSGQLFHGQKDHADAW